MTKTLQELLEEANENRRRREQELTQLSRQMAGKQDPWWSRFTRGVGGYMDRWKGLGELPFSEYVPEQLKLMSDPVVGQARGALSSVLGMGAGIAGLTRPVEEALGADQQGPFTTGYGTWISDFLRKGQQAVAPPSFEENPVQAMSGAIGQGASDYGMGGAALRAGGTRALGGLFGSRAFGQQYANLQDVEAETGKDVPWLRKVLTSGVGAGIEQGLEMLPIERAMGGIAGSPLRKMATQMLAEGGTEALQEPIQPFQEVSTGLRSWEEATEGMSGRMAEAGLLGSLPGAAFGLAAGAPDQSSRTLTERTSSLFRSGGRYDALGESGQQAFRAISKRNQGIARSQLESFDLANEATRTIKRLAQPFGESDGVRAGLEQHLRDQFNAWMENPGLRDEIDLPPDLLQVAQQHRALLDKGQTELIELTRQAMAEQGVEESGLETALEEYLGSWVTRSFMTHVDPNWKDSVLNGERRPLFDQATEELLAGPMEGREEHEVQNMLMQMLEQDPAAFASIHENTASLRAATEVLSRQELTPALRAMLGEIDDPAARLVNSVSRQRQFIENWKMTNTLLDLGRGSLFFEEGDARPTTGQYEATLSLGPQITETGHMGQRTVYTSPEIRDALLGQRGTNGVFANLYLGLNGGIKTALTAGNPQTHLRNISYWSLASMSMGHHPGVPLQASRWIVQDQFPKVDEMAGAMGYSTVREMRQRLYRSAELGVIGESTSYGEARKFHEELGRVGSFGWLGPAKGLARSIDSMARELYGKEDDWPRHLIWEARIKQLRKVEPDLSDPEIEELAAHDLRRYSPTWSMAPPWTDYARKFIFAFPFPTFQAEYVRATKNIILDSLRDYHSPNPARRELASKQLAGTLIGTWGAWAAARELGQAMGFMDDDEKRKAIQFLTARPWEENENWYTGDLDDGRSWTVSLNYVNPMESVVGDVARAFENNDLSGATRALVETWGGSEPLFEVSLNIGKGAMGLLGHQEVRRSDGTQLYNPEADPIDKAGAMLREASRLLPAQSAVRLGKAVYGTEDSYGRVYDPGIEAINQVSPYRVVVRDLAMGMDQKVRDSADRLGNVQRLWKSAFTDLSQKEQQGLLAEYPVAKERWARDVWPELQKVYSSAQAAGVPNEKILAIFKRHLPQYIWLPLISGQEQAPELLSAQGLRSLLEARLYKYQIQGGQR